MTDHAAVTVEEDGIRVEKSFSHDEFPVPAVTFRLVSNRAQPTRVRIIDTVPESFPMNRVGFHPDYESENWTAYEDHRVEYERVLDPDEDVLTVFGIRDDDPDVDAFLTPPLVEHAPEDESIEDVLGADNAEPVREVLAGDRDTLQGMEEPLEESDTETDPDADEGVADDPVVEGPSDDAVAAAISDVDDSSEPGLDSSADLAEDEDEDEDAVDVDGESIDLADPSDADSVDEGPADIGGESIDLPDPDDADADDTDADDTDADDTDADDTDADDADADDADADDADADDADSVDEPIPAEPVPGEDEDVDEASEPRDPNTETTSAVSVREDSDVSEDGLGAVDDEPESAADEPDQEPEPEPDDEPTDAEVEVLESTGEVGEFEVSEHEATEKEASAPVTAPGDSDVESIAATLAEEIRAGDVADDDLNVLRAELDLGTDNNVDVRISRLQSRVEDLAAYTDALEEFIDEEGTAGMILGDVQSELADVRTTVDEIDDRLENAADERANIAADVTATEDSIVEVEDAVDTVEATVASVEERVDSVEESVDSVEESVDTVEESVDTVEESVETVEETVDTVTNDLAETTGKVDDVEGRVDGFDEELGDIWEDVAELDRRLTDVEDTAENASDLHTEITRIDEELAELEEFRDSLSSAFGG